MPEHGPRLRFLRRSEDPARTRFRRGVYLLPSLFTLGNMFCGYICIVHTMRGEYESAAPFIGVAVVLDMLDGRIARMTGSASAFGVEFDSLADVISFGLAPAVLAYAWGLAPLGRIGLAAGFLFVSAAAIRLARFNIQSTTRTDKRYFAGMPSPAAAGILASTVFAYPAGLLDYRAAFIALAVVLVPAALMVSTIRFRSFKTFDLQSRRPYRALILVAAGIVAIWTYPRAVLVVVAYSYLLSAFIGLAAARLKRRGGHDAAETAASGAQADARKGAG